MRLSSHLVFSGLTAYALATPVSSGLESANNPIKLCDQYGQTSVGPYTIYNNNFGAASASSGSQCTTFEYYDRRNNYVRWSTKWTWNGSPGSVKSFADVKLVSNKRLSSVKSIRSVYSWSYTGERLDCDVSFDAWFSSRTGTHEVMIWLASLGGASPTDDGGRPPVIVNLAGRSWKLYKGTTKIGKVYSFIPHESIPAWNDDISQFFKHLAGTGDLPQDSTITSIQAGTEAFTGTNAEFKCSRFSVSIF